MPQETISPTTIDEYIEAIYKCFLVHGEVKPPMETAESFEPPELKALMKKGSEWHVFENHYNVYGLNLMSSRGKFLPKVNVLGDEELIVEWKETFEGQRNSASDDYECFAAISEYDYLFVNINKQSKYFGEVRLVVNNCVEDTVFSPPPFSNFVKNYLYPGAKGFSEATDPTSFTFKDAIVAGGGNVGEE